MRLLARDFDVIAPDMPGHGDSDRQRGDHSLGGTRLRDARPAARARDRARDHRRPLARRRGGDAVLLPVPRDGRAAGAGRQRRARARGQPADPQRRAAVRRAGAAAADGRVRWWTASGGRRAARTDRAQARRRPGRDLARHRLARRHRTAGGVRAHRALGDEPARPARDRQRPALPGGRDADADRLGRPRPDHPGRARPRRPRAAARQPARDLRGRRALPPARRPAALRRAADRVRRDHRARPSTTPRRCARG